VIHAVADALDAYRPPFVVLDPVMVATSGAKLLCDDCSRCIATPPAAMASVITPNLPESRIAASAMTSLTALRCARRAAEFTRSRACVPCCSRAGHLSDGGDVVDIHADADGLREIIHDRLPVRGARHRLPRSLPRSPPTSASASRCQTPAIAASDYVPPRLAVRLSTWAAAMSWYSDHFGAAPR
jgi:hydroxymethylpyrimidine/phosphomethylpyrimidine kinase